MQSADVENKYLITKKLEKRRLTGNQDFKISLCSHFIIFNYILCFQNFLILVKKQNKGPL